MVYRILHVNLKMELLRDLWVHYLGLQSAALGVGANVEA